MLDSMKALVFIVVDTDLTNKVFKFKIINMYNMNVWIIFSLIGIFDCLSTCTRQIFP